MAIRPSDGFSLRTSVKDLRSSGTDAPTGVGTLGMKLFVASLSFIFAATILLYAILLAPADPPDVALLPIVGIGAAVSTVLIVASSVTLRRATRAVRAGDGEGLVRGLRRTLQLGYAFGVVQTVNWVLVAVFTEPFSTSNRHAGFFIVLTVLHALHVVGGVVRLAMVERRARAGEFGPHHDEPITNVAIYWHFLDIVWVLLVLAIVAVSM